MSIWTKIQSLSFASKELWILELQFLNTYCNFLNYQSNWCVTEFANNSFNHLTYPKIAVLFRIQKTNPGSSLPKISTKKHSRIMMILVNKQLAEDLHDSIVQQLQTIIILISHLTVFEAPSVIFLSNFLKAYANGIKPLCGSYKANIKKNIKKLYWQ